MVFWSQLHGCLLKVLRNSLITMAVPIPTRYRLLPPKITPGTTLDIFSLRPLTY
jgi:hypothetical protein